MSALVSGMIMVAGCHLSIYGDVIAEKTGLPGSWREWAMHPDEPEAAGETP